MEWSIQREDRDVLADVRISLGYKKNLGCYMVFRGDPHETVDLLKEALKTAEEALPRAQYADKRGRPQG